MNSNREAAEAYVESIYGKGEYNIQYDRPAKLRYESFLAGCEHAEKSHREFALNVREYCILQMRNRPDENDMNRMSDLFDLILKYTRDFTEREQQEIPFKD